MPGSDAPAPLTADTLLGGRYRIVRPVASGGMAAVWEGRDEVLARSVAIKVLHPHLAADQVFLERFRREAVAAARLSHPNIVATFDAGTAANGTAFIVMELVRGTTLRQHLAGGALPAGLAVAIGIQIADALRHAHAAGLVHRDIKPANVLLCHGDIETIPQVKVTDFGIAKAAAGMGLELTRTGMVLGTPKYLSPEQVEGLEPDARADLYSLGVVLFEMLTGDPPFTGPTEMAVALARLDGPAPRVGARCWGLPPSLDRLVTTLLARDPDARPPSAVAVRHALAAIPPIGPSGPIGPVNGTDLTAAMNPNTTLVAGPGRLNGPTGLSTPSAPMSNTKTAISPGRAPESRGGPGGRAVGGGRGVSGGRGGPGGPDELGGPGGRGGPAGRGGPGGLTAVPGGRGGAGGLTAVPGHGETDRYQVGRSNRRRPRRSRWPGRVIAVLAAVALVVAFVILSPGGTVSTSRSPAAVQGGSGVAQATTLGIADVSVFHLERNADNAAAIGNTHDGNPATVWWTDHYFGPNFAGLRHGLGLAITLNGTGRVHRLKVESPTLGWSAQVYLAGAVPARASLTPWGQAVAVRQGIDGGATFDLGGRQAGVILLWITVLGPTDRAGIAELAIS